MTTIIRTAFISFLLAIGAGSVAHARVYYECQVPFTITRQTPEGGTVAFRAHYSVRTSDDGFCRIYTYGGRAYPCSFHYDRHFGLLGTYLLGHVFESYQFDFDDSVIYALAVDTVNAAVLTAPTNFDAAGVGQDTLNFIGRHRTDMSPWYGDGLNGDPQWRYARLSTQVHDGEVSVHLSFGEELFHRRQSNDAVVIPSISEVSAAFMAP